MEQGNRPSRSDAHLSLKEEEEIEKTTREYFDGIAPKRHTKPLRSEYAAEYTDAVGTTIIPELLEFQRLEHDPKKLITNNSEVPTEEFVETEYYKDLNCVDKLHHTTGTGFISMENTSNSSIKQEVSTEHHASCKGNPATNEWTPSTDNTVDLISNKPSRSGY